MKFAVIGSGGVGGYFGAQLAKAGEDVMFTARGKHLEAMQAHGLRVVSTEGTVVVPASRCVATPEAIGPVDVVLFCVKSYDTESAGRTLKPLLRPDTVIISLQNGVENEDLLRGVFPDAVVFGGVAYVYATITRPGEVTESGGPRKLVFGPFEGSPVEHRRRATAILDVVRGAGIAAEVPGDIIAALWKKFIFITGAAGLTALTRLTLAEILAVEPTRLLLADAMGETLTVARGRRVHIEEDYLHGVFATIHRFDNNTRSSLYYDLVHGKPLELEALSGAVVRFGTALGVPTPVHRTIYAALLPYHLKHTRTTAS
ncbi:MAG: 2-dehydropantoate 2-reductase [Bacteroidota bacterium]